jgi:hypothetical protein
MSNAEELPDTVIFSGRDNDDDDDDVVCTEMRMA